MPSFGLVTGVVAMGILLAYFLKGSPPTYSKGLTTWIKKGNYFTYNGHKIFYQAEKGAKFDGSAVVCLHGFPTFSYDWHKIWSSLQEMYGEVIALDFIGFGMSDKPYSHNYSFHEQADIVEFLLTKLGLTKVHLLAHDYGDTVAQELLARFNECSQTDNSCLKLESVVLLNGGIFPETNFPRLSQKVLLIPYLNQVLCRLTSYFTFSKAVSEVFGPNTQPTTEEFEDFWAAMKTNNGYLVTPKLLTYIEDRKKNRDRWVAALRDAVIPLHVIYGPADPVNPPDFVEYYRKMVPKSSVSVLGEHISHYPQSEDPEGTWKAYKEFMDSIMTKTSR